MRPLELPAKESVRHRETERPAEGARSSGQSVWPRLDSGRLDLPALGAFFAVVAIVAVVGASIVREVGLRTFVVAMDFRAYYTAGHMVVGGVTSDFYRLERQHEWQRLLMPEFASLDQLMPFYNPPFLALVFAPLAALPLTTAYLVWSFVELALLAAVYWLLADTIGGRGQHSRIWQLVPMLFFFPTWLVLFQGQVSFVLVLGALASWRALRTGNDFRAGFWLALLLVRPQLLIAPLLVLLLKGRWRTLATLGLSGAALLAISLIQAGWDGLVQYVRLLQAVPTWGDAYAIHPQAMHTWRGFLHRLIATDSASAVDPWWIAGVVPAVVVLILAWRGRWDPRSPRFAAQWALLVVVALFTSPHAYYHDLSLLLVSGALIVRYQAGAELTRSIGRVVTALPLLVYVAVNASLLLAGTARLQLSVLAMTVTLIVLATLLLRGRRVGQVDDRLAVVSG